MVTSVTMDRQLAGIAVAKLEAEVGPLALAAGHDGLDGKVMIGPGYEFQGYELPVVAAADTAELWAAPLTKLYLQHPSMDDDTFTRVARETVGGLVDVVLAGAGIVEMLPLGLTKATGLSLAARRLGVKAAGTIAFGDMPNDIPMLAWSAHAVAMGNAHDEVKDVAHEVAASNDDDGIALVLERLLRDGR
jgi:hydroxymethylpyrimidine pyrophosphatase-like HAD family hydrolase